MAKMSVSGTPGTGTITLGSAVSGFQTFDAAGVLDQEIITYGISDAGGIWEVGYGVYTTSGTTLTRNPRYSSNSNSAASLTSTATVWVTALAEDLNALKIAVHAFAGGI